MKVAHILWGLRFGGIETLVVGMANCQLRAGAEVTVVIVNDMYEETLLHSFDRQVRLVLLGRKVRSKSLRFILRLNHELNSIAPDVIHLHSSKLFGLIWSGRLRRAACVTLHALPYGATRRPGLLGRIFPSSSFLLPGNVAFMDRIPSVFAISEAVQQGLREKYGIGSTVIHNGIAQSDFRQRPLRMPRPVRRIIQVGRLIHEEKGQALLIEAAARLRGQVEVDFVGDGRSKDFLEEMIRKLNAESFVHLLGNKSQAYIARHLPDYDLLVQPSLREGFGLTVVEAMAARLPVLASAGQGPAEILRGETYGWTFRNGNACDLGKKIDHIFSHYGEALMKAREAQANAAAAYDISVTARRYLQEYRKL